MVPFISEFLKYKTQPTKKSDLAYVDVFKDDKRHILAKNLWVAQKDRCFVMYLTKRLNNQKQSNDICLSILTIIDLD